MEMRSKIGLSILFSILLWSSCKKDNNFPDEPVVKYESYSIEEAAMGTGFSDSLHVIVSFTDGDGDLGEDGDCVENNLIVGYFELVDGEWEESSGGLELGKCLGNLTPEGQDKALEGEIKVKLGLPINSSSIDNDSIRLSISLRDRAGHVSVPAFTELILTQ